MKHEDGGVLVLADAHVPLDDRRGAKTQRQSLHDLLQQHGPAAHTIMLLGDTFDFWFEWKHAVPKRGFALFHLLRELVDSGTPIHYFAGNHDFHLGPFLRDDLGLFTHLDAHVETLGGKRWYFHHGDGLAASDRGYRRMKAVFRNPLAQKLFGALVHPDLALELGKKISNLGREKHQRRGVEVFPPFEEYQARAREILRSGHDAVVIGHVHKAFSTQLDEGLFCSPGPFLKSGAYGWIENGTLETRHWR